MSQLSYEPWDALYRLQAELDRVFKSRPSGGEGEQNDSQVVTGMWTPAVDIKEEPERFLIYADLPGVDIDDIDVTMEGGVLTIKGERRPAAAHRADEFKRSERTFGTFYRRFSLPDSADAQGIRATGKQGVLEIAIPKSREARPRRIPVSA